MSENKSDHKHLDTYEDGKVVVTAHPEITEREIYDDRQRVILALDEGHAKLIKAMAPFQSRWDAGHGWALADAAKDGVGAGVSAWGEDFADLFKAETWCEIGKQVKDFAGSAYDAAAAYIPEYYRKFTARANKAFDELSEHPVDTLKVWAWDWVQAEKQRFEAAKDYVVETANEFAKDIERAKKMYAHRDAIMALPKHVAEGDIIKIQSFIDNELKAIDPEWSAVIRNSPGTPVMLELIADHDSALSYLTYVSLMIESVPPNFYVYVAGKGGVYLLIELILTIVLAFFTGGTAAVARVSTLAARILASSARVAAIGRKVEKLLEAFEAFVHCINIYEHVTKVLYALGQKLVKIRQRAEQWMDQTLRKMRMKRKVGKRDSKCQHCRCGDHRTPRGGCGVLNYV